MKRKRKKKKGHISTSKTLAAGRRCVLMFAKIHKMAGFCVDSGIPEKALQTTTLPCSTLSDHASHADWGRATEACGHVGVLRG